MAKEVFKQDLPLHMAVERRAPDDVIISLLEANKKAAMLPGKSGSLPLHSAAQQCLSPNVIVALIKAYPEGLDVLNNSQYTPRDFHQRNDFSLEALMRPTACWIEDVEKEAYIEKVKKRRLELREKVIFLRGQIDISQKKICIVKEMLSKIKPVLEEQEEIMKQDKTREDRSKSLKGALKQRMVIIKDRIMKLEENINKEKSSEEMMINTVLRRTYMEEAQKKYEKVTQAHNLIERDLRSLREIFSGEKDANDDEILSDFDSEYLTATFS